MQSFSEQFKNSEPTQAQLLRAISDMVEQNRQAMLDFMVANPCDAYKLSASGFMFLGQDMEAEVWNCLNKARIDAEAKEAGNE